MTLATLPDPPFFATGHVAGKEPEFIRQGVVLRCVGNEFMAVGETGKGYRLDRVTHVSGRAETTTKGTT